jgi:hypothetical protein
MSLEIIESTVLPSAARTTTQTQPDQANANFDAIELTLDVTAVGTGSQTLSLQGYDEAAAGWRTLLASAAIVAVSTVVLRYGPTMPIVANASAAGYLPKRWRAVLTANNGNSQTSSVSARLIRG